MYHIQEICTVAEADKEDVDRAVAAARDDTLSSVSCLMFHAVKSFIAPKLD